MNRGGKGLKTSAGAHGAKVGSKNMERPSLETKKKAGKKRCGKRGRSQIKLTADRTDAQGCGGGGAEGQRPQHKTFE